MRKIRLISAAIIAGAIALCFSVPTFAADPAFVPGMAVDTGSLSSSDSLLSKGVVLYDTVNDHARTIESSGAVSVMETQLVAIAGETETKVTANNAFPFEVGWHC